MARPAKWNAQTTSIRVPEHAVDQLLDLARLLDQGFVQNSPSSPSRVEIYMIGVDDERFIVSGDVADPRLEPIMQRLDSECEKLGLDKQESRLLFAAKLAQELERRGVIQRLKPRA
jgi:hypothetical protein